MNSHGKQVEEAIRAVVVHPRSSYSWFGKRSPQLTPKVRRLLTPGTARNYLLFNLQVQLYTDFYGRGFATPSSREAAGVPVRGRVPFVEELSAANSGAGHWQDGWKVHAIEENEVMVQRDGLNLWVRRKDCSNPGDHHLASGQCIRLRLPKESVTASPGFYMAHGNAGLNDDDSQGIVRVYLNLTAEGAIQFMKQATLRLNLARLPFDLKALNDRQGYSRCDAVVLYIRKRSYHGVADILREIYPSISVHLKQRTPVFTKALVPGIGLAEDPGQGMSFGEHRCRLVAEGIVRAREQGKKSLRERFRVVADHLAGEGVDLERPYLNPGSSHDYEFEPPPDRKSNKLHGVKVASQASGDTNLFLRTAEAIAHRLAQEAVWHGDRCNWLGTEPVNSTRAGLHRGQSYRALGPELYDGTSGVALFLAEMSAAIGDAATRRTALGAIAQALSRVDAVPPAKQIGLYAGTVGIAFVAARAGSILAEAGLLEQAARLLRRVSGEERFDREFDLVAGPAGAIPALMILQDILEDKSLIDVAVRLGDKLLQSADKSDIGYSWRASISSKQRNLTGFSHGSAGVGYAMLELFHATGETKYRVGAERAFDYERHWFNREAGNWPDFREELRQGRRRNAPLSFATFWCHGAPGIALSRLRAYQLINDATCKAEAITALETTRNTIRSWLHSGTANYSLCHGLAGNAETLIYGCEVLGQRTEDRELVADVAHAGCERYAKRGGAWPCGVGGEETPSLMLGLAGIGHFYLRLHVPKIPSILILQPDDYEQSCRPECVREFGRESAKE